MASEGNRRTSFRDKHQTSSVMYGLNEQRKLCRFCDVVLKVCGQQIFAHSNILASASEYFGSFLGCGQDWPRAFSQKTPQIIEIYIDGTDGDGKGYCEAVRKVVDFMYTSRIDITTEILNQVTEIAKIMQMNKILEYCELFQKTELLGEGEVEVEDSGTKSSVGTMTDSKTKKSNYDDTLASADEDNDLMDDEANDPDYRAPIKDEQSKNKNVKKRGRPRKKANESNDGEKEDLADDNLLIFLAANEDNQDDVQKNSEINFLANVDNEHPSNNEVKDDQEDKDPEDHENKDTFTEKQENHENEENQENIAEILTEQVVKLEPRIPKPTRYSRRVRKVKEHPDYVSHHSSLLKVKKVEAEDDNAGENKTSNANDISKLNYFYMCKLCNETYRSMEEYKVHKSEEHSASVTVLPILKKEFICSRCDFITKKQYEYKEHMKTHLHDEQTCSFCEYKASDQSDFELHIQKHSGDFPYFCMLCDTRFKNRAQYNAHMPKHSVVKPFVCEICNAGFKWKHALKSHMITHSATKDQLCDICGFATAHKSMLKAHKLIHSGNTYKCDVSHCNFQATKKQNLKYHMLTHSGEKPHQCEVCGQSFSLVKNMKRHMLMHSSEKPIKCNLDNCQFATTRFDKLKEHKLKQHGTGVPPTKKLRLSDYENITEGQIIHISENQILTEPLTATHTLQEGQIIATVDNSSIIGHVQYAEIDGTSGIIQYVTTCVE